MQKPEQKAPQQKTIETMTTVELAKLLQDQFQTVSGAQQKIMQCQQNIWNINMELDKRQAETEKKE